MLQLILVRHGNTFESWQTPIQVGAKIDLPLTQDGRKQAEIMARYLMEKNIQPVAIYCGTLKRQVEFAQILGPFQISPALTEIDYGPWEGLTVEEIKFKWPKEYVDWNESAKWPDLFIGSKEIYWTKLQDWLEHLKKNHPKGSTLVAVTSNGVMRLFENHKVKTGHFCKLALFENHFTILNWNQNPGLEGV